MIVCFLTLGGLCNRMRTMSSVIDLAHRTHQKPFFIWVRMPDMNASFGSLFKDFPALVISVNARGAVFKTFDFLKEHWCEEFVDDAYVNAYCKDKLSENLQRFKNKKVLVQTCENITGTNDYSMFRSVIIPTIKTENCIGVHIRRTDNEASCAYSPTSLFVDRMQKAMDADNRIKFYLATDSPEEETVLNTRFPGRLITTPKRSLDRNNQQAIEDALVDLYCLAHCRMILGSYFSSFSDVAASWGNIEKVVIHI